MRGDTAHGHAPHIRDISGGKIQIQHSGCLLRILAVHFKEIPDLIQYHIVRVRFLDGVIAIVGGVSSCILCQLFIITCLFIWRKIAVQPNQLRNS